MIYTERMELDQNTLTRMKLIKHRYEGRIPSGFRYYYGGVLDNNQGDIKTCMESFSLTEEEVRRYAKICKIIEAYNGIIDLIEMAKADVKEIEGYKDFIAELRDESKPFLDEVDSFEKPNKEETKGDIESKNLIIYSGYIDDSQKRTVNARSGREEQAQRSIANLIEQLNESDYNKLRQNGDVNHIQDPASKMGAYVGKNAFERFGSGSTKICYVRLSVSEKNREEIKRTLNSDFDILYLVLSYGDFKNEGCNLYQFFGRVCADLKRNFESVLEIVEIFKNDFTEETRPIAMSLINNGFRMTEELTACLGSKKMV